MFTKPPFSVLLISAEAPSTPTSMEIVLGTFCSAVAPYVCVYGLELPVVVGLPKTVPKTQPLDRVNPIEAEPCCCPYA